MGKLSLLFTSFLLLAGCSGILEKQEPVCDGVALVGGQETNVFIYGIRKVANQTQYRAGYPFNWQWVGKNNFISTSCNKA
ncbi:cor protein [Citrobacter portucalensis]|uniref:phage exclusion lipoprotein Cor n=1 Tax=Citrobacter portucalensis TaxID=1639133 RepID=UPI0028BF90BF|nr:cor protein [Citrobacter freundii]MDT7463587.1 cor protein [Citrobacter portucalensis]